MVWNGTSQSKIWMIYGWVHVDHPYFSETSKCQLQQGRSDVRPLVLASMVESLVSTHGTPNIGIGDFWEFFATGKTMENLPFCHGGTYKWLVYKGKSH